MFTASPALRAAHPEIRTLSEHLTQTNELAYWLETAFSVLDNEPILVLHPTEHTGITARISGVDVNFALNMLLMRDFPGASQPRLSPKAASVLDPAGPQQSCETVTGCWNLYNYTALDAKGHLPTGQADSDHWIWNEGKPSDIATFEGRRVILLGPPAYPRIWPAQRTFAAMIPKLEIESVLKPKEVDKWITRLTRAPK
ncbi:MAG: hypothetical protein JST93_21110 [Acidobacteria bacterium]|nr:hypothetical protein [Acidobacteriota bacterium]